MFTRGYAARKMPVPKGPPLKPVLGYASEALPAADAGGAKRPKRETVVASYRLDPRALAVLNSNAEGAGISPRSWLESSLLQLPDAHIVARKDEHPDLRALLFQVARAGNNLNQIAHKFNRQDLAGQLRAADLRNAIAVMDEIAAQLHQAVERAR